MPVTPYHFGPGLLGKSLGRRHFSMIAFIASNIIIDLESLYHLVRHEVPVHRQLHTFLGAAIVGIVTAASLVGVRRFTTRFTVTTTAIAVGAMTGALTHPLLDGIMHADIEPFQPWTASNPLLDLVSVNTLEAGCVVAGVIGVFLLLGYGVIKR